MSEYNPDKWAILKVNLGGKSPEQYRVIGSWYGGYLGSDSWRMNSGITKVVDEDDGFFSIHGVSGSIYNVHKNNEGMSSFTAGVIRTWQSQDSDVSIEPIPFREMKL